MSLCPGAAADEAWLCLCCVNVINFKIQSFSASKCRKTTSLLPLCPWARMPNQSNTQLLRGKMRPLALCNRPFHQRLNRWIALHTQFCTIRLCWPLRKVNYSILKIHYRSSTFNHAILVGPEKRPES